MLVVVFGAGASYDSALPSFIEDMSPADRQFQPPIARHLFKNQAFARQLFLRYPDVSPVAHMLSPEGTESTPLEVRLQRLQNEAQINLDRRRQLVAVRFYLRDLLHACGEAWWNATAGVTNYRRLIDDVINHQSNATLDKACYVTFNYDCLLDRALTRGYGAPLTSMAEFAEPSKPYSYIKLHGSTDWVHVLGGVPKTVLNGLHAPDEWLIEHGWDYSQGSDRTVVTSSEFRHVDNVGLPALSIPVSQKDESTYMAGYAHVAELRRCMSSDDATFLLIGWRGQEAHFLKLWRECRDGLDTDVFIVDQSAAAAQSVADTLREGGLSRMNTFIYDQERFGPKGQRGFTSFTLSGELDYVLARNHTWVAYN